MVVAAAAAAVGLWCRGSALSVLAEQQHLLCLNYWEKIIVIMFSCFK
jgi:hypothetical protein